MKRQPGESHNMTLEVRTIEVTRLKLKPLKFHALREWKFGEAEGKKRVRCL